jgi:hypothetical protein
LVHEGVDLVGGCARTNERGDGDEGVGGQLARHTQPLDLAERLDADVAHALLTTRS